MTGFVRVRCSGRRRFDDLILSIPRHSKYGIFTYIGVVWGVNVGIYDRHGVSGICFVSIYLDLLSGCPVWRSRIVGGFQPADPDMKVLVYCLSNEAMSKT